MNSNIIPLILISILIIKIIFLIIQIIKTKCISPPCKQFPCNINLGLDTCNLNKSENKCLKQNKCIWTDN